MGRRPVRRRPALPPAPGEHHPRPRRRRRLPGRQPRPAAGRHPRDALRRQHRRRLGHQHARAPTSCASSPPISTIPTTPPTRCRAPRSRARAPGRCSSTRCWRGTLIADYLHYQADNDDNTELNDAELIAGAALHPERELHAGRRARLRLAPALRRRRDRRARDHPGQQRALGPRQLPLRDAGARVHAATPATPRRRRIPSSAARSAPPTACRAAGSTGGSSRTTPPPTAATSRPG